MATNEAKSNENLSVTIPAPKIETIKLTIEGIAPLCINRFSQKAKEIMMATQAAGSTAKGKKVKEAKDFDAVCEGAKYTAPDGWNGIHAAAFRNAAISACRLVGFKMTLAKLSIFIVPDGYDIADGTPLVKITKGTPERWDAAVRNQTGVCDIRSRPLWREWGATLTVRYDAAQFTRNDVVNLFARVGLQVGIGEGRPDSKESAGLGYGLFQIV